MEDLNILHCIENFIDSQECETCIENYRCARYCRQNALVLNEEDIDNVRRHIQRQKVGRI